MTGTLTAETQSRDPLTGLSTYSVFFESVQRALAKPKTAGNSVAVLSINLDQFRYINDDHGQGGGDAVLVEVSQRLRAVLRRHDGATSSTSPICRVGGDDFLCLCEGVQGETSAAIIATEVLDAIAEPVRLDSARTLVTARVGFALAQPDSRSQQLILDAETAQHHAEHIAGDRYYCFKPELREARVQVEPGLVEAMQHALVANEFRLVYQPKISLITNRIVGVEALLRWERPGFGTVMPHEFIPTAELSGVIVPIGKWVLREAFRQAATWHAAYPKSPVHMAVNVSARQFQTGLVRTIRELLDETGINANTVSLEVTETTIMADIEGTIRLLAELKALGFKISIDDYGTGYSSLEYLHRMPIDELKIDRSFVAGLGENAVSDAIVASIISLAQTMNQEVVAEGVETHEQLDRIRTMGCDFAQGYLIARPVSSAEVGTYLAAHATGQTLLSVDNTGDSDFTPWIAERVLIIDDASDVRMLARMCLTAAGFTVEEAGTGAEGLELARRSPPACILLDVGLPDSSGTEVCRSLRDGAATKECTIVMLTVYADRVDKADAFLAGADDYMVKPFTPRDLVARVRSAIDRRRTMIQTMGRQVDGALLEMLQTLRDQSADDAVLYDGDDNLSSRQIEILRRMLGGQRVSDVARDLFLSQSTVRNHLSAIYQRFNVHSQAELLNILRKRSAAVS